MLGLVLDLVLDRKRWARGWVVVVWFEVRD